MRRTTGRWRGVYLVLLESRSDYRAVLAATHDLWGKRAVYELGKAALLLSCFDEGTSVYDQIADHIGHGFDAIVFRIAGYHGVAEESVWDWLDENA